MDNNNSIQLQPEVQEFREYLLNTRCFGDATSRRYSNLIQRSLWSLNREKAEVSVKDIEAVAPSFTKDKQISQHAVEKFCQYLAHAKITSIPTSAKPRGEDVSSLRTILSLKEENRKLRETLKTLRDLVDELITESDD